MPYFFKVFLIGLPLYSLGAAIIWQIGKIQSALSEKGNVWWDDEDNRGPILCFWPITLTIGLCYYFYIYCLDRVSDRLILSLKTKRYAKEHKAQLRLEADKEFEQAKAEALALLESRKD